MTADQPQGGLSQLLKDLENPLEQVRQAALEGLERFPAVSIVRAVRRVAATDPAVSLRLEARRVLQAAAKDLFGAEVGVSPDLPLERLAALLSAPEPALRVKAIRALALSMDPRTGQVLKAVLARETEAFVRASALLALAAAVGPDAVPVIFPFLSEQDPRLRATAVEALEATGDARILPHLVPLIQDPHHRVRAVAARALQAHDPDAVLACVDAMLGDPQEMSVRSAAFVLRYFAVESALSRLVTKLDDARPGVAQITLASVQHMARAGSVRATQLLARRRVQSEPADASGGPWLASTNATLAEPLEDRLASASPEARVAAVRLVLRSGRDDLIDRLRVLQETENDPRVLATLVSAIGLMGSSDDVRWLRQLLTTDDARLRANAVEAIGLLSRVRKVPLLTKYLTDPNNRVRANAVVALHGSPNVDVLPVLKEMASGMSPLHALSAAWACMTIGTPPMVKLLAELLGHADAKVSTRARHALQEMARVMPEAAAALATGVADPLPGGVVHGAVEHAAAAQAGVGKSAASPAPSNAPAAPAAVGLAAHSAARRAAVNADPELDRLLFEMRHESPSVRQDAAKKLAERKDPALLPQLRALLHDDDPGVRRAAREAGRALLSSIAPRAGSPAVLGAFEEELAQSPELARKALERVLDVALSCGIAATTEAITARLMQEQAPFVRAGLISALGLVGDERATPMLTELAKDPDARVRANAVDALELLGGAKDLKAAIACLADPDPRVRAAAIVASLSMARDPFLDHLRGMLESDSLAERAAGLYALQAVLIPERGELLKQYLLRETQPRLYESAADSLVKELSGNVEALELVLKQMGEGDKQRHFERCIRRLTEGWTPPAPVTDRTSISGIWGALSSMGQVMDMKKAGQLTPDVIRDILAKEKDPISVSFLLSEAADLKLDDTVELAQPFTHSKDRRIRLAAAEALGKVGKPEASEAIAFLARDRDPEVARKAIETLEKSPPAAAEAGIKALIDTAHPVAVKQGLELIERRGDPAGLELALTVLQLGADPALVEPLMRLVKAWGSESTIDALSAHYQSAAVPDRPLIRELGTAIVEARGLAPDLLLEKFAESAPVTAAAKMTGRVNVASLRSRAVTKRPLPQADPRAGFDRQHLQYAAAGGFMILVMAVLTAALGGRGTDAPRPSGSTVVHRPATVVQFDVGVRPGATPVYDVPAASSSGGYIPMSLPGLAEVKAALKLALASKGIRSDAVLTIMALDRVQVGYRGELARARFAMVSHNYDEAFRILEAALEQLDAEHYSGRLQILRTLEILAREAQAWDRIPALRKQLKETSAAFNRTLLKAASDGDIPDDKLKKLLAHMEAQEKKRAQAQRGADWLAGADVGKDAPLEPLGN